MIENRQNFRIAPRHKPRSNLSNSVCSLTYLTVHKLAQKVWDTQILSQHFLFCFAGGRYFLYSPISNRNLSGLNLGRNPERKIRHKRSLPIRINLLYEVNMEPGPHLVPPAFPQDRSRSLAPVHRLDFVVFVELGGPDEGVGVTAPPRVTVVLLRLDDVVDAHGDPTITRVGQTSGVLVPRGRDRDSESMWITQAGVFKELHRVK